MSRRDPFDDLRDLLEQLQNEMEDMSRDDDRVPDGPFGGSPFGGSPFGSGSPFGPNFDLEEMLDDVDTDFDSRFGDRFGGSEITVDVLDGDGEYIVTADMPGFDKDDIGLQLADTTLHISANREDTDEEQEGTYIKRERYTETASRAIDLPEEVEEEGVEAEFQNGVLTVTLPKESGGDGHEITIE